MQGINKVTIEAVSIKDPMDGDWGKWWPYGIKVADEWWNGSLKSQEHVDAMQARKGEEIEMFFYQDNTKPEQYRNKVRFVTDKDRKEQPKATEEAPISEVLDEYNPIKLLLRIEVLEERMNKYDETIAKFEQPNKEPDYVNRDDIPLEDDSQLPF